jgi:hypothetical protein
MDYKFKYTDDSGENEYKVFFETISIDLEDETNQELDGPIYLEDHNGDEVDFINLFEYDKNAILEQVDAWIERSKYEGEYNHHNYMDEISDHYDAYGEG